MKYEGEVRELELIPSLVELGSEGFTGALRFENDSIIKIVYFKEGSVLSASTNDRADSIDEILLRSGKVSREHVKQALTKRKDEETLGDAMLGLGFITRKELSWARRVQLIGILRSVMSWDSGTYTLVADYLPKREEGPAFPLEQIVLELVLTDTDRSKYDALLDSGAVIFRPSAIFDERFPSLGLNQEAAAVVRLINGSRTASDVVGESTSDAFNVYKLMHALHLLGLLEKSARDIDLGLGAGAPAVPPTQEMPMDFGSEIGSQGPSQTEEFDFGMPSGPGVDLSWQQPVAPEPEPSRDELLPSIDSALVTESGGYDFEPSVPERKVPPVLLTDDLPAPESAADEPRSSAPVPAHEPPSRKPVTAPRAHATGGGGGRKIAFLVVGVVIIAALAYAGYVYFLGSGEPDLTVQAVQEPVSPVGASASGDQTAEPEAAAVDTEGTAETPEGKPIEAEPVTPEPPRTTPAASEPAPRPATAAAPAQASGRLAEMGRANLADASSVAFTVQFALFCQDYSVDNAIKVGGSDFWFVPINYQGRACYRAFWGRYASRQEAERGAERIPASLRGGKPVVVEPAKLTD